MNYLYAIIFIITGLRVGKSPADLGVKKIQKALNIKNL